jgi:hypothetical protein
MKKRFLTTVVLILLVTVARSQVIFWVPQITANPEMVSVPIYVKNFDSLIMVGLSQHYPANNLTFLGYQNVNPNLGSNITVTDNSITIFLNWYASSSNCISIPDSSILIEIVYDYSGGVAPITWNTGNTITKCDYSTLTGSFIDGGVNTSVSVQNLSAEGFDIYPNPASDRITLSFRQDLRNVPGLNICIFDILGRPVMKQEINPGSLAQSKIQISLDLKPGQYNLEISNSFRGVIHKQFTIIK